MIPCFYVYVNPCKKEKSLRFRDFHRFYAAERDAGVVSFAHFIFSKVNKL